MSCGGMTVNTVGIEKVPADYDSYPLRSGHPDDFYFDLHKGRTLDSYQLVYITEGKGTFYTDPEVSQPIESGDMFVLRPYCWHSYFPDRRTGWTAYWIGI